MLLLCSKIFLKPHIPLKVRKIAFSFFLVRNIISHITMHIHSVLDIAFCWYFSFYLCFIHFTCIIQAYSMNLICIQYGKHTLLANLLCPNYWLQLIRSLTWSQQNTVAKLLEVIVISHRLTRAKDAFVKKIHLFFFFFLRQNKLSNTNCNRILCIWELVDYLCGDNEYHMHAPHFWKEARSWL